MSTVKSGSWSSVLFRTKPVDQLTHEDALHGASHVGGGLKRALGVWDLTAFGVAAVIGAGIFSTIGNAAHQGGPAVVFLFIFTAIACGFSALCYAEFASAIPVAGSAYTYAYATFGELMAWIIGWDLLMEYAIGNIAVAISWGDYFANLLANYGIHIPNFLMMDYLTASRAADQVAAGGTDLSASVLRAAQAWQDAPRILGVPVICNILALLITAIITWIVYIGIEESRKLSNFLVVLKVLVVLMVISVGAFYIHPENWIPFAPNGAGGVLKGVSAVFFAYIGFDAISTTAEECRNPQRDLPRGMFYSLIICTVLYVLISLVLTGMVNYKLLAVGDPLAFVFGPEGVNLPWISSIISVSAVVALATVLLVFQLGQPRIWMSMSRDGLLPPIFSAIHPKYKTPWFSTLLTGLLVAVPSLFMNLTEVTDLTSIGTLFAFILVCGGVLRFKPVETAANSKRFKTPYFNSQWIFPALLILTVTLVWMFNSAGVVEFFSLTNAAGESGWEVLKHKIPLSVYSVGMLVLSVYCFTRRLSLIPVMGLATCGYLMTELGIVSWIRFGLWLAAGLVVYFLYGIRNSRHKRA